MKTIITKSIVAAGGAILVVAAALVVKLHYFPAVNEAYFAPDADQLRRVPAGLAVVRPTTAGISGRDAIDTVTDDGALKRAVGRDVTFRELIAQAYDCSPGNVILPAEAPEGRFDFVVTTATAPREHLRAAIRQALGFTARTQSREADVLKLEVADTRLPGLTPSPEGEPERIDYNNGRLYFSHKSVHAIVKGLEEGLAQPVLDDTGLSGRYDYSIVWNQSIDNRMHEGTFQREGVDRVLRDLGLRLEAETATGDTVIVERAK